MFTTNKTHLQQDLFGTDFFISDSKRKKLQESSDAFFYDLIFCNIIEKDFAPLFSTTASRPNAPINSIVAAIILSTHKGWTVKELFDRIDFDLLTRTALGLHNFEDTPFTQSTFYSFQNKLNNHYIETNENLLENVFDKLTAAQLEKLKLKTDIQRMDSFQAMANIRSFGRTQLLVEVLIRLYRILSDTDKESVKEFLSAYINQESSAFVYALRKDDIEHTLSKLADTYHNLYLRFNITYKDSDIFKIFKRVYEEHFSVDDAGSINVRESKELTSSSLQSPDDLDATFRTKRGKNYRGQVINIAETANPDNKINLITDVAVESNNIDDSKILNARIDTIKNKYKDLNELHTDGGYGSSENDTKMIDHSVNHVQTAVRGRIAEVSMKIEPLDNDCYNVSCPMQTAKSEKTKTRLKASFDLSICATCQHSEKCPAIEQNNSRTFYFNNDMYNMQKRATAIELLPKERKNLRPNIEATVKEFTKAFNHKGKLRIRGKFKTILYAIAMSIGINFGRIFRYIG